MEDTWARCTPDGKPPVVGKTYRVACQRKGRFEGTVMSADETTFAQLTITKGEAKMLSMGGNRGEGEEVNVRSTHCTMVPIE